MNIIQLNKEPEFGSKNGYSINGIWNSLVVRNGKNYRERVEALIIKNNKVFLSIKPKSKSPYRIPGGSSEPGISLKEQLQNECKEEAKIFIKNPIYICTYEKEYKNKGYANELPFQYSAYLTHLYIATYNGKYNGFINECDLDNDMYKYGKFYDIDKVSNILLDEHKFALSTIMNKDLSAIIESLLI